MKLGNQEITARKLRHVAIYQNGQLVLLAEDMPGTLISTAGPNPNGPAKHDFINAQAIWAPAENQLGALLGQSKDFTSYLKLLISNQFDVFSIDSNAAAQKLPISYRIFFEGKLVAACYPSAGQFMSLEIQPEIGQMTSSFATMTIYDKDKSTSIYQAFSQTDNFEEMLEKLNAFGFTSIEQ